MEAIVVLLSRTNALLTAIIVAVVAMTGVAAAAPPDGLPDKANERGRANADRDKSKQQPDAGDARVVVAVIDSSTNPYHEFFQTESSSVTPEVLAEFGIGEDNIISLTRTGDFEADYKADKAKWDAIEEGEPYWFEGTNLIGITFDPGSRPILPDSSSDTHGVGTTAAVLDANPEAIVVLVEGITLEGESWAFTHPAVDAVSTSYGWPGSPPLPWHVEDSYTGVVELGKHHFGAADNSPAASPPDTTSGPWWTIAIAGFQEGSTEGRQTMSGNAVDFVGDFTQELPYCWNCESEGTRLVSGTSFATPRSAGTFSRVLLKARRAAGHTGGIVTEDVDAPLMVDGSVQLTNWQLRRALEEGAYYPTMSEWSPGGPSTWDNTSTPVVDAAPWAQTGWGAITPDPEHGVIQETLAHAGFGEPTRHKSDAACAANTANIEARRAYWDNVNPGSESWGTSENPYIYC